MSIRVLIVDDEPLARRRLRRMLAVAPDIEIVGECGNGVDAVSKIEILKPELVFLDIQMPELDGFGVIKKVGAANCPLIIFVTAYDQYAISAFEIHALDYLLKPFDDTRLLSCLDHVRGRLSSSHGASGNKNIHSLLEALAASVSALQRVPVKVGDKTHFVEVSDIDWIEASGNYVTLHTADQTHLIRMTMKDLIERLDPRVFRRIHRNTIINTSRLKELKSWFHGDYIAVLKSGVELSVSRRYRKNLDSLL